MFSKFFHTNPRQATDANIIVHMCFACSIAEATDMYSEYVVLIAFPPHQRLCERVSLLCCTLCLYLNLKRGIWHKKYPYFWSLWFGLLKSGLYCLSLKKHRITDNTLSVLQNLHEKLLVGVVLLLLILNTHLGSRYFLSCTGNQWGRTCRCKVAGHCFWCWRLLRSLTF